MGNIMLSRMQMYCLRYRPFLKAYLVAWKALERIPELRAHGSAEGRKRFEAKSLDHVRLSFSFAKPSNWVSKMWRSFASVDGAKPRTRASSR